MNQDKQPQNQDKAGEVANKTPARNLSRVDNERIKKLEKGFLFGFSAIDLFLLLAALLAVGFMQFGSGIYPLLESTLDKRESIPTRNQPLLQPTHQPEISTKSGEEVGNMVEGSEESAAGTREERLLCESTRPQVCTQECIVGPPFICGSDGISYCSPCQACANPQVEWYLIQDEPCPDIFPNL